MKKKYADKLKVGDKVTIKKSLKPCNVYGKVNFSRIMDGLQGKTFTIKQLINEYGYISVNENKFNYSRQMFNNPKKKKAYTHTWEIDFSIDPLDKILKDVKDSGKHFDDLTKIDVPFGELDKDTQDRLKDAYYKKGHILKFDGFSCSENLFNNDSVIKLFDKNKKENKIPEKIELSFNFGEDENIANKINEIIDYLSGLK